MADDNMEHARGNAKGWLASIEEMLAELEGHEAAARADGWEGPHKDKWGATYFEHTDGATWACADWRALCDDNGIDAERSEEAEQRIGESVLSVSVRDGWHTPGAPSEDGPEEYEVLLSTGGPALRIWGKLREHGEPDTAELQMQDWGTPWTRYPAPEETLLAFVRCFYFGE